MFSKESEGLGINDYDCLLFSPFWCRRALSLNPPFGSVKARKAQ